MNSILIKPILKRIPVEGRGFVYAFSLFYFTEFDGKQVKNELIEDYLMENETYTSLEYTKVSLFGRREIHLKRKGSSFNFGVKITNSAYDLDYTWNLLKVWLLEKGLIDKEDIVE